MFRFVLFCYLAAVTFVQGQNNIPDCIGDNPVFNVSLPDATTDVAFETVGGEIASFSSQEIDCNSRSWQLSDDGGVTWKDPSEIDLDNSDLYCQPEGGVCVFKHRLNDPTEFRTFTENAANNRIRFLVDNGGCYIQVVFGNGTSGTNNTKCKDDLEIFKAKFAVKEIIFRFYKAIDEFSTSLRENLFRSNEGLNQIAFYLSNNFQRYTIVSWVNGTSNATAGNRRGAIDLLNSTNYFYDYSKTLITNLIFEEYDLCANPPTINLIAYKVRFITVNQTEAWSKHETIRCTLVQEGRNESWENWKLQQLLEEVEQFFLWQEGWIASEDI